MLRKILIASTLLMASGSALAIDQIISKPRVSITFGGGNNDHYHHDQYREVREVYVPYREVYREVYVPRPVHVQPVYYNNYYRGESRRHHGWGHRNAHHDEWKEHKKHKRHHRKYHHDHDDDDDD